MKVIIIGGGIVGCAVQFALAKRGWTDSLLLEKGELTSGSTWHAAGNTTHFGHDPAITRLYVASIDTYLDAQNLTGQDIGFHRQAACVWLRQRLNWKPINVLRPYTKPWMYLIGLSMQRRWQR